MALDLTVHRRDNKGRIVDVKPYRLVVRQGVSIYEMPRDSGSYFLGNGEPCNEHGQLLSELAKLDKPKAQTQPFVKGK